MQRDGHEHALVAQPVEGGDRLLEPLGGDPHPAEGGRGGLQGRAQRGGDVHLADGGVASASTTSAETISTTSPLTSPDSPAETAAAAPGGSGTVSGSLTGAPATSCVVAGTRRRGGAGRGRHHGGDGLGVLGAVGVHAVSFTAACGVGTIEAARRRRWLLAIA